MTAADYGLARRMRHQLEPVHTVNRPLRRAGHAPARTGAAPPRPSYMDGH